MSESNESKHTAEPWGENYRATDGAMAAAREIQQIVGNIGAEAAVGWGDIEAEQWAEIIDRHTIPGELRAKLDAAEGLKAVVQEFCQDVQAIGIDLDDWPDLRVTYEHAQAALRSAIAKAEKASGQ